MWDDSDDGKDEEDDSKGDGRRTMETTWTIEICGG
jgi:hypothetical protein